LFINYCGKGRGADESAIERRVAGLFIKTHDEIHQD